MKWLYVGRPVGIEVVYVADVCQPSVCQWHTWKPRILLNKMIDYPTTEMLLPWYHIISQI